MNTSYNYEKTAQLIIKSTQAEAAMGRLSRQASKREPWIGSRVVSVLFYPLVIVRKVILALLNKKAVLNS